MATVTEVQPDVRELASSTVSRRIRPKWLRALGNRQARTRKLDATFIIIYVVGAFYVTMKLWINIGGRVTGNNVQDHAFFQFVFAHAAHSLASWQNPLFNPELNAPFGVNMMANTSFFGLSLPLAPVTLLLGPRPSVAIATMIGLAGTAAVWYFFLLRYVTAYRFLAFVAAGFIGFAPGMISQANAHPNIVAQFMVPLIISRVIQLREPGRAVRHGTILGAMAVYQMFLNEEVLLYIALICAVLVTTYAASRPAHARELLPRYLRGLGMAIVVAGTLLAYPLWFQFAGPQHYTGPFDWAHEFGTDLAAFTNYASESAGGTREITGTLSTNPSEENAFFGWPLCMLGLGFGVAYWRLLTVRLALVGGLSAAVLSLGSSVAINGDETGIPAPWRLVNDLPLLDAVIVTRMALLVAPAIAIILVVASERVMAMARSAEARHRRPLYTLLACSVVAALWPLFPTPLPAIERAEPPVFVTAGMWKEYVSDGTVYPAAPDGDRALDWLVGSGMQMPISGGYFLGPNGGNDRRARFGPPEQDTRELLEYVGKTGRIPMITDGHRRAALRDLRESQADVIVLESHKHDFYIYKTVTALLGMPGEVIGGAWVWDLRGLA